MPFFRLHIQYIQYVYTNYSLTYLNVNLHSLNIILRNLGSCFSVARPL